MRSSSGLYFSRLDHVRALAAFLVWCWHFVHVTVPFSAVPDFFALSILEEGHAGVALFMTLSGYLFAKITAGNRIDLKRFYWNRFVRLAPLLAVMLLYWALRGRLTPADFISGLVRPTWPAGMWSIVAELHFYLVFPVILALQTRARIAPLMLILLASALLRTGAWMVQGQVQDFAYWTIGGCIDLFVIGMLWHELAGKTVVKRHAGLMLGASVVALLFVTHALNRAGGFFDMGGYPSPSPLWIVIPTIEALLFGAAIVAYESVDIRIPRALDKALATAGEVSYSVYLLQFTVFTALAKAIAAAGVPLANLNVAIGCAALTFPLIVGMALVSYRFIERPFLSLRARYDAGGAVRAPAPIRQPQPA